MSEELVRKVIALVTSSRRAMPAHFTSNGDRTQSFCIDFEPLTADDEYNMASASYEALGKYFKELSAENSSYIIRLGEDTMLTAYIISKLGHSDLVEEAVITMQAELEERFAGAWARITSIQGVSEYCEFCSSYGQDCAS